MDNFKNILYIGQYGLGSTSKMRGDILKNLLHPENFQVVNITNPITSTNRIFRSFGWRYKFGPLIKSVNNYIKHSINPEIKEYDLIWVDKGVFIQPETTRVLRSLTPKLIHFTPDPTFTYHNSNLFFKSLSMYDHTITTKSFEIAQYKRCGSKNIIYCTQGYDPKIHKPHFNFYDKSGISFIGHHEKNREVILQQLLKENIPIVLAGIGWDSFVKRNKKNHNLKYLGKGIYGSDYASTISSSLISLGFLSKIIPELHTTRTIEIPACGTALITERTTETEKIFDDSEVFFIDSSSEWASKIKEILTQPSEIQKISENGYKKITQNGFDYEKIIFEILNNCKIV